MGYQITFKPTAEAAEKLKTWNYQSEQYNTEKIDEVKTYILTYCMEDHNSSDSATVFQQLSMYLRLMFQYIEEDQKNMCYNTYNKDENHEFYFRGWEYSHDDRSSIDKTIDIIRKDLIIWSCMIKTPDYFESDTAVDNFYKKLNSIEEILNDFEDMCVEHANYKIIEDFKEFEVKYDEEDYSYNEPENTNNFEEQ